MNILESVERIVSKTTDIDTLEWLRSALTQIVYDRIQECSK